MCGGGGGQVDSKFRFLSIVQIIFMLLSLHPFPELSNRTSPPKLPGVFALGYVSRNRQFSISFVK